MDAITFCWHLFVNPWNEIEDNFILIYDNAQAHRSSREDIVQQETDIQKCYWSTLSPNVNPIESVIAFGLRGDSKTKTPFYDY